MIAAALIVAACIAAEPAVENPKPQVAAISGHGGLTAGLDASGVLTVLRWPNPGGANMIRTATDADSVGGGRWGIEINGAWRWIGDPAARVQQEWTGFSVFETTTDWPDGVSILQISGVVPGHDIFFSSIAISGARTKPRAVWIAEFAPTMRQVPELAAWEEAFNATRGFAAFVGKGRQRIWNFRPAQLSAKDWSEARKLTGIATTTDTWTEFGDGVWIALSSYERTESAAVTASIREAVGAISNRASMLNSVVGSAVSAIEPVVQGESSSYGAAIYIRVAESHKDSAASLPVNLFSRSEEQTREWPHLIQGILPAEITKYAARHWLTLRALQDNDSGLSVRGIASRPAQAMVWPKEAAIVDWAKMLLDDSQTAEAQLEVYLKLIRTDDRPRKPYGSMPESVYTSGEIASPHFVVDDRAVALTLWAIVQAKMPIDTRAAWLKEHWPEIEAAGEFLSTWADARRGAPLWCDDPIELSDAETQDRLFSAYAGMNAAITLATWAEQPVPAAWISRRDQLHDLIEWVLTTPGKWIPGESIMLELTPLSSDLIQRLYEDTTRRLENPIGLTARPLAALLLQSSLLHARDAGIAPLPAERVVVDVLTRLGDPNHPAYAGVDSLVSAEVLAALRLRQPVPAQH